MVKFIQRELHEQFEERLKDVKDNAWDEAFTKYFEKNIGLSSVSGTLRAEEK